MRNHHRYNILQFQNDICIRLEGVVFFMKSNWKFNMAAMAAILDSQNWNVYLSVRNHHGYNILQFQNDICIRLEGVVFFMKSNWKFNMAAMAAILDSQNWNVYLSVRNHHGYNILQFQNDIWIRLGGVVFFLKVYGRTDRQTDGRTDGQTDGRRTKRHDISSHLLCKGELKMISRLV